MKRLIVKTLRLASGGLAAFAMCAMLTADVAGANIVWVSFHPADETPSGAAAGAGFTEAPDVEYTRLLRAAGHTVTRYVTTATPDVAQLNTYDLVIISRSVPSGNYQTPESTALWHSITKPTIQLGGYVLRASRLGYTYGETIPDIGGEIRLLVNEPAHPIFTGVDLDGANLMVNPYADRVTYNGVLQRGISVNTDFPADGATILATVGTDTDAAFGGMIIGEYPAGTTMVNGSFDVTAGKRLVLLTGSREQGITAEGAGIFDLKTDGARLFLNSVNYMVGLPVTEPPPFVSGLSPNSGATRHYAPRGLSFTATSGTAGGIPVENISLVLNGTDVSSQLVITGTAQERVVNYTNLAPNIEYTGVITVRDAGGREAVLNFTFDTLPPFALPAEFAFPTSAAVASAPGLRARIAQAYDFPELANTAARAEAQLAGTLIDPNTLEPYPNLALPSTDNPDGSYNQQLINWNVDAGITEIGNFQAPDFPDEFHPGIGHNLNIAAEILTYLELSPGRYFMGVNSDDGFVVYSGVNARDLLAVDLGRFDGGRGSADTIFQFDVTEAGLYPFRLLYYQGGGGANLEWFTVDPLTGEKILINDRNNPAAVHAWRQISTAERPYVSSLQPAPGEGNVAVDAEVIATIQDGGAQVQQGAVQMTLNGQPVSPQVTKAGSETTVRYSPAQGLQGDTQYTVNLTFSDSAANERTVTYDFTTRFVPTTSTNVANIVWVSFHEADDIPAPNAVNAGFTNAADVGYTELLRAAGHEVTRYVTTATPDVDYLNTFDLVIVSRGNPSGNFQNADSTALWHSITSPTIHLGGYLIRANRLGYTTGDTIPDTTSTIRLGVSNPAHPIFTGIELNGTNMVNPYAHIVTYNGTVQRGISVNTSPIISGGTILATVNTPGDGANNGMIIAEYPAGTTMGNASADVNAAKALVFLTGSREQGIPVEGAGIFDLEPDGAKMFLNAVSYMAGFDINVPTEVALSASVAANGDLVISWPESGTEGYALEATSSLSPVNWQAVAGTPSVSDGQRTMTIQTTESARFFRLAQP